MGFPRLQLPERFDWVPRFVTVGKLSQPTLIAGKGSDPTLPRFVDFQVLYQMVYVNEFYIHSFRINH